VARAQAGIQALREEAEQRFAAAGGRDFQGMVDGLVEFMKRREKTVFGKQALWTDCCERRYHELLVSRDPQVQAKLAKAAEEKAAAMVKAAEEKRSQDLLIAVFQRHVSTARLRDKMCELGRPIEFLNTSGHQRWHKSHHMIDMTLQAVRGFVGGKLVELHQDFMKRAADQKLAGPDKSWKAFFDLEEPSNAGLPQGQWLLLLKKAYHSDALSDKHRILFSNTNALLLADTQEGPMEIGKFFATTLGGSDKASKMKAISDLDAEATFNIVKNCSFFDRKIRDEAAKAAQARNDGCHRKAMSMDTKMCESIHCRLRGFLELVPGCDAAVVALDHKYQSNVRYVDQAEFQRFEQEHTQLQEMRSKGVQSFLKNMQDMCSEVGEVVKRCLRDWPAGSRKKLLDTMAQTSLNVREVRFKLTWMQGHRGSGKSSAICKLREELLPQNAFVLHHSFIRSDSSSSLQVAVGSCCVQLLQLLLESVAADDRNELSIEVMTDLIGTFDQGLGKMEIRELLLERDVAELCDVLVKLLGKLDEQGCAVTVVIFLDAIDEVFERYETEEGFESPDRTLHVRVLHRLRAACELLNAVTVTVVASSTQAPPLGARCELIHVDEASQFFSSHDIDLLIDIETPREGGALPFWASCAVGFMKLEQDEGGKVNCPPVSDLRLLRTWVKLTFKIARMLVDSDEPQPGDSLCEERAARFREKLGVLKATKMDQVVQMYLFQCMLNAFPDADPDVWHTQVDEACRVLLLTAYLGVNTVDVTVFEFLFRRYPQDDGWCARTVEYVRLALRDFLVSCSDCVIVFQPYYMDVFRRSLPAEKAWASVSDESEESGSFYELSRMVRQDSRHSSQLRLRTNKLKHQRLFQRYEGALSDVKGLVDSGLQLLRNLDEGASHAAGEVQCSVWFGLLDSAMQGESCSAIAFIFRVLVSKYKNEAKLMPRVCSAACAVFESALSYRQTREGEGGMWCFQVDKVIAEFSGAVKVLFGSGLSPVFWKASLPTILKFLSKHAGGDSALDVMQAAGKGSYLDSFFPAHYCIWPRMLSSMSGDADAHCWLRTAMASNFSPVECMNMELLSCSGELERQAMLHRIYSEECETNDLTWLIVLGQSKGRDECERILLVEMPKRGIRPMDGHWGYLMRYCSLEEREAVLQNLIKSQGGASVFVWNSVMLGQKCAADREKVLELMKKAGVQPNDMTCSALIQGYSSGAEKEMALERMVKAGVQPNANTWSEVIAGYSSGAEKEMALERMVAAGVQPNANTWSGVIAGYSSGAEKEKALERMVAAGVQPDTNTWSGVIGGYWSGAEKEKALERMVAAGVQPNANTWTTVMGGYASFVDRVRVFQRMTAAPHAVVATRESRKFSIRSLFGSVEIFVDASHDLQTALDIARGLPDDLLCDHEILGKLLPLCAEANDPQLLHILWGIGAAGLINP